LKDKTDSINKQIQGENDCLRNV